MATGYEFSFPFLDNQNLIHYLPECETKQAFGPLYLRMFCINEPNLIFIICGAVTSAREKQSIAASYYISKKFSLPTKEQMMKKFNDEIEKFK